MKCCRKSTASSRPFSSAGNRPRRKRKCNRRTQINRPNAVGAENEQYPQPCNGNCKCRYNLQGKTQWRQGIIPADFLLLENS